MGESSYLGQLACGYRAPGRAPSQLETEHLRPKEDRKAWTKSGWMATLRRVPSGRSSHSR